MSRVIAYDIFGGPQTASVLLSSRVSASGHAWATGPAGFSASGLNVSYLDSAVAGSVKGAIPGSNISRANYLPSAPMPRFPSYRARGRRCVRSIAALQRGFLGIGFFESGGAGVFGGWENDATPEPFGAIVIAEVGGGITFGDIWNTAAADPFVAPFSRELVFDFQPQLGNAQLYFGGVLVSSVATGEIEHPTAIYPGILYAPRTAPNVAVDAIAEVVYEGIGEEIPDMTQLVWTPYRRRDWKADVVLDFSAASSWVIDTDSYVGQTSVKARTVVLSSYSAANAITVTIDDLPVTIPASRELVLAAPDKPRIAITGTPPDVLRARFYSIPYEVYQRD